MNRTDLTGHLGADPDIRFTSKGTPVVQLRVATSERWKDRETGENRQSTEWHDCVWWATEAQIDNFIKPHVKKGHLVQLTGKSRTRKYTDKDGIERKVKEVHVDDFTLLEKRPSNAAPVEETPADDPIPF